MFGIFNNGIKVIKKTKPGMCGGTDATLDTKAPKKIKSDDMIFFEAKSALNRSSEEEGIGYISAFAIPCGNGTFILLETADGFRRRDKKKMTAAVVKENVFPSLAALVNERDIAKNNGYHSKTHGLPEDFGGSVDIRYASGEKISFSNNQSPVFDADTADKMNELFGNALQGERIIYPSLDRLKEIRFTETRRNGGYTKAVLTLHEDGTGTNAKESRYDEPTVYKSEKSVSSDTVKAIKENIENTLLLAWADLPERRYKSLSEKELAFVFSSGEVIKVQDDREVPDQLRRGFFNVELEMTTKS